MKGYCVYSQIHQLKEKGFRKTTVAKMLGINRRTVNRYWDMLADDYEINASNICRERALGEYASIIVKWLHDYPSMSAAQVCDWLKEHYSADFTERTVSRFVKDLREEYGNAGSRTHEYGARAKKAVQTARTAVAEVVTCSPEEVVFTSGATESNNLAILGLAEHADRFHNTYHGGIVRPDPAVHQPHMVRVRQPPRARPPDGIP